MTRTPRPAARLGMSVLEALLATAIFLMAIAAIGQLIESGTNSAFQAARKTTAVRLAQSKMAECEAGVVDPTAASSGSFDDNDADWMWSVEPAAAVDTGGLVIPVTVRVTNPNGRKTEYALTQMVLDPSKTGSAAAATAPTTGTTP